MAEFEVMRLDKENSQSIDHVDKDSNYSTSFQTPLQRINRNENSAVGSTAFSPVTPVSGTRSRTPCSRQASSTSCHRRKTFSTYSVKHSPLNVMNTLVYNKAMEVIDQELLEERKKLKELLDLLNEKDKEIQRMQAEIDMLSQQSMHLTTNSSISITRVSSSVDSSKKSRDELVSDLEAAEISNDILRSELASLKQKQALLEPEMGRLRLDLENVGKKISQAVKQTEASYEKQIEELSKSLRELTLNFAAHEQEADRCQHELQLCQLQRTQEVSKLREDLSLIYKQKKQEADLCSEYRSQYEKATQVCIELKAQLDEYVQLRPVIEEAMRVQATAMQNIQEAYQYALEKGRATAKENNEFIIQKVEWLKWKDDMEQNLSNAQDECHRILEDSARHETQRLELLHKLADFESRMEEIIRNFSTLDLDEKNSKLNLMESINLVGKQMSSLKEQLTAEIEKHELEVTNLQRTVDMREHDIDELTKECNNFRKLVTCMKTQVAKQQSVISKVSGLESQMESLEAEKTAVSEEMQKLRSRSCESEQSLQHLTHEYMKLEAEMGLERHKVRSLENDLLEKIELLSSKEMELVNISSSVKVLYEKATSFFEKLTSQWNSWSKALNCTTVLEGTPQRISAEKPSTSSTRTPSRRISAGKASTANSHRRSRNSRGRPSIICEILAAQNQTSAGALPCGSTIVPEPACSEVKQDKGYSNDDHLCEDGTCEKEDKTCKVKQKNSKNVTCSDGSDLVSLHSLSSSEGDNPNTRLREIQELFQKINSLLQDDVAVTFIHMNKTVKLLQYQLEQERNTSTMKKTEAQVAVRQAVSEVDEMQRELEFTVHRCSRLQEELKEREEQTNKLKQLLNDNMSHRIGLTDQKRELQKLNADLGVALRECQLKDEQIQSLRAATDERLQRIEANSGEKLTVIRELEKENAHLKLQKQKLLHQNADEQRQWDALHFRLQEQHRSNQENIKKAENTICQLNDKIKRTRMALQPHVEALKNNSESYQVLLEFLHDTL